MMVQKPRSKFYKWYGTQTQTCHQTQNGEPSHRLPPTISFPTHPYQTIVIYVC